MINVEEHSGVHVLETTTIVTSYDQICLSDNLSHSLAAHALKIVKFFGVQSPPCHIQHAPPHGTHFLSLSLSLHFPKYSPYSPRHRHVSLSHISISAHWDIPLLPLSPATCPSTYIDIPSHFGGYCLSYPSTYIHSGVYK